MIEGSSLFLTMFNNLAVFVVFVTLYGYIKGFTFKKEAFRQILSGILFGITAVICMTVRIHVAHGVIVDQRNAIIVLSTLYGGLASGLITLVFAAIFRAYLGGMGVLAGIIGMFLSLSAGLLLRFWRRKKRNIFFYLLGPLAATIILLPGFLPVGSLAAGWALLKKMALPYGTAIYLGILFVGLLIEREENRVQTAVKLKESEKKYRNLYKNILDVSYQADADGILREISPSVERITGFKPEELVGNKIQEYYVNAEERTHFLKEITEKGSVENFRTRLKKKDGGIIWASTNAAALYDTNHHITGVQGIVRDISRLKNAEDEKERLKQNLQQSQKLEALGTLAGGIAHDFNNILGAILGYTELASESAGDNAEEKEYLEAVLVATERARNLISQILTFSRHVKSERQLISPEKVVQEAVALLRQTIPSSVNIETDLNTDAGLILADENQIHQVILNLGTNAFHALHEENGDILIKLYPLQLKQENHRDFPALSVGSYICLEVIDSGRGIEKDHLERIFEPFFSTKEQGKGTGLGLAVVHGIIQDHGGQIYVDSTPGKGTRMRVLLPAAMESEYNEKAAVAQPDAETLQGHERILVVDDEKALADLVTRILQSMGYEVYSTSSPLDALEEFKKDPEAYDLLLTDQTMPKMTGWELASRILAIRSEIPVIIATGYSSILNEKEAKEIGVRKVIVKPLSKQALGRVVRRVLDQP